MPVSSVNRLYKYYQEKKKKKRGVGQRSPADDLSDEEREEVGRSPPLSQPPGPYTAIHTAISIELSPPVAVLRRDTWLQ